MSNKKSYIFIKKTFQYYNQPAIKIIYIYIAMIPVLCLFLLKHYIF